MFAVLGDQQKKGDNFMKKVVQRMCMGCNTKKDKKESITLEQLQSLCNYIDDIYTQKQGQDYLDYGLLYNLRYSQSWPLDLGNSLINFAFSMTGKTIILFTIFILISLNHDKLKKRFQFNLK